MGQSKQQYSRTIAIELELFVDNASLGVISFPVARHLKGVALGIAIEAAAGCLVTLLNNPDEPEALAAVGPLFNDKAYLSDLQAIGRQLEGQQWYGQVDASLLLSESYGGDRVMRFFSSADQCEAVEGNSAAIRMDTYVDILKKSSRTID